MELFAVCATHGICEADPYGHGEDAYPNGTLRCLCDDGYKGEICEQIDSKIKIIDQNHPGLLAAIVICIILLGIAIVCSAVLCHKIRIAGMENSGGVIQGGGEILLNQSDDALNKTKAAAMSMDIVYADDGNQLTSATGSGQRTAVQLQTMDDQLEQDTANELLDDNNESDNDDDATPEDEEEEEEEEETTNPGAE